MSYSVKFSRVLSGTHIMMLYSNQRPKVNFINETKKVKNNKNFKKDLFELFIGFAGHCTLHGMSQIAYEKRNFYEKIIWMLLMLTALGGTTYVCITFSASFRDGKLETVIDSTEWPVYRIEFPVVTICNRNRLNWERFSLAQQHFLPEENNTEILNLFELIISLFDDFQFPYFEKFNALEHKPLHLLNHVNFSLVFEFMTWTCEEMLADCSWRRNKKNCCEIFSRRKTKMGLCWSFNSVITKEGKEMLKKDPKWPWRTGLSGRESALNLRIMIKPELHYSGSQHSKGIDVMITEPKSWHTPPHFVAVNTQSVIKVEPVIYVSDNDTRKLGLAERKCVFMDETNSEYFKSLNGLTYMIENCVAECHQEHLINFCNCTMNLMFPEGPYPYCRTEDLLCLAHNNDYFQYTYEPAEAKYVLQDFEKGIMCECFRNCYSLNYVTEARSIYMPPEIRGNKSFIDLDVHFRDETFMVYRTRLVFNWLDLLVSFGGVVGLFMGCSMLSLVEILYFLIVDLPIFVRKDMKTRKIKPKLHENVKYSNYPRYYHEHYLKEAWPNKDLLIDPRDLPQFGKYYQRAPKGYHEYLN